MPLTGTFNRNMDDKCRFAVPKRLREQFEEEDLQSLFIAPGINRTLELYSHDAFETLANQVAEQSPTRADIRTYSRLFFGRAERVDLDSQGRVRVPERLVAHAQLQKEIVLVGVRNRVEVWDAGHWQEFTEENQSDFDSFAEKAFS